MQTIQHATKIPNSYTSRNKRREKGSLAVQNLSVFIYSVSCNYIQNTCIFISRGAVFHALGIFHF